MRVLPRMVMAALRGGSGKTVLTLGLLAAWHKQKRAVIPFKKGPDYIDAAWLSLGTGSPCYNLDTFLMGEGTVLGSFTERTEQAQGALIEGNRGLFDGMDREGTFSTAELAKLLKAPLVLILDCTKATRTLAAMVLGCQVLDPKLAIRGVILNQVAGKRHETLIRETIRQVCRLPVLGAIPRLKDFDFPQRHLGLTPPQEHLKVRAAIREAAGLAERYLDLDGLWKIMESAGPLPRVPRKEERGHEELPGKGTRIGIIRDSAFQFYYPENLESLKDLGVQLVELSAVKRKELPSLDGMYIGGGFPETHAGLIAENRSFRSSLRAAIENGLPVYAECGGLMYLGETLTIGSENYPMIGILPLSFKMEKTPQGHGYTILEVEKENPFFPRKMVLKGHEFHYSKVLKFKPGSQNYLAFQVKRGQGLDGKRDGLCYRNVLATYTHLHALGTPAWAEGLVRQAVLFKGKKSRRQ